MDNKLCRLSGVLLAISLLVLSLAGCESAPWDSGMVLVLKVDEPRNGITTTEAEVTVRGRVLGTQRAGARVTVNGAAVPVKDDKFSTSVKLTEGTNVINVEAEGSGAKPSEKVSVAYLPSK